MDLSPSPRQAALRAGLAALLDKESTSARVRAAEPLGFDVALWDDVVATGVLTQAAGLVDLALLAEEAGAHLAPVPLVEAAVTARLLTACGEDGAMTAPPATFALHPVLDGTARLVPAGAVAGTVIAMVGDELVAATDAPPGVAPHNLASLPIADRIVSGTSHVLARGDDAHARYARAVSEWRLLTAAALVGLAQGALDLAITHVKNRHQFGVPIGSFQAVKHRLADVATELEGVRLLTYRAAWLGDKRQPEARRQAAVAFLAAAQLARQASSACVQLHGGYGFTIEHDPQLFYRRAKGWPLVLGDPRAQWLELPEADAPTGLPSATESSRDGIEFTLGDHTDAFRVEVQAFLREHVTPEVQERVHRTGTVHDWDFHRALAAKGWVAAAWPVEFGGQGRDPWDMRVFAEECAIADAPTDGLSMTLMVANTLRVVGTDEQKRDVLPRVLSGDVVICLGYSEPEAGSDVAAASTTAMRDGDDWVINGQKVFTSLAHEAQYIFLLTRTNHDVPKHRGLTMFLVPTNTPGIEIEPIPTLGAPGRTNRTFYTDVRVSDALRVGEVDGGWAVMNVALTFERGGTFAAVRALKATIAWAQATMRPDGSRVIDDPLARERLARVETENDIATLLSLRSVWIAASGGLPGVEGSMAKLYSSESIQRSCADLLDLLGPSGLLSELEPDAPAGGAVEYQWRKAAVATIYGGSSEILRGIIAERHLGLPKAAR